jgi:hypothetical protein
MKTGAFTAFLENRRPGLENMMMSRAFNTREACVIQ